MFALAGCTGQGPTTDVAAEGEQTVQTRFAQCKAEGAAKPLCQEPPANAPHTRYPVVIVPGSSGRIRYFIVATQKLSSSCGRCPTALADNKARDYGRRFAEVCDLRVNIPEEDGVDPYAYCCGSESDGQMLYVPKLQGFQTSERRSACLAVHTDYARDVFAADTLSPSSLDTDGDGSADHINMLGYSLGGVDAAIVAGDPTHRVRSVTALSSPMRGSMVATAVLELIRRLIFVPGMRASLENISESAVHELLGRYILNLQAPGYEQNENTEVIAWLKQLQKPHPEIDKIVRPDVLYQSFAAFAIPNNDFYRSTIQWPMRIFWGDCRLARAKGDSRTLAYTQAFLNDLRDANRGLYAYGLEQQHPLEAVDVTGTKDWSRLLPTFSNTDALVWVLSQVMADERLPRAGDGQVPVYSAAKGDPVTFHLGDVERAQEELTPGRWRYRGLIPGNHGGIIGSDESETGSEWVNGNPYPNPCTGHEGICFMRNIFYELAALRY